MLLALRNDADAVRFSVSGRGVTAQEHECWFRTARNDPSRCRIWIAEDGPTPVGQVRVDLNGDSGTVSIAVAADQRGRGIGTAMLKALTVKSSKEGTPSRLTAMVRSDNEASLHAFAAGGFRRTGEGSEFLELEWP
jgi:RimJ/RimL family protein N-acetyltransferase